MSELPIPQEAVEAAAKALGETAAYPHIVRAEAALRAGLEAMGVRVEEVDGKVSVEGQVHYPAKLWRLVSRWLPVEQDS